MRLGDSFLLRDANINDHLQVVITDPEKHPTAVILVSITTYHEMKEDVCIFNANEHSWIKHKSCVSYSHAKKTTLNVLSEWRSQGKFEMFEPFEMILLQRIWRGAPESITFNMGLADILDEQGLIDL